MIVHGYIRIVLILGMVAVLCSAPGAAVASMGIVAEPHETSGVDAPVCTAPCECMSESIATQRWGVNGYELCSKTICGQSADAMVQYHCIHQVAGTVPATNAPAQVPVASAALPAAPAAAGATQKSPVGVATLLAAIGTAVLAAGVRRK
jgi:hypothetical protein